VGDVGQKVVGVLDAQGDADETVGDGVAPPAAAIDRGVEAPEAGGRDQQLAARHQRVHGRGIGQLDGHQAAESAHLLRCHGVRRIVDQPRVAHRLYRGMSMEHRRKRLRVLALPLEPEPGAP
jgi:hypothetical protein